MRDYRLRLVVLMAALALAAAGCKRAANGFLEGAVTVGPLTPVERMDAPSPTPPPEVYTSRALNVFKVDGVTLVKRVPFEPDGSYRVELPPGTYVVDIEHSGIDSASGLPTSTTIRSGETTRLDIDIDTGIR